MRSRWLGLTLSIVAMLAISGVAGAAAMAPDDPSVSGNLIAWYTDPGSLYTAVTGVWTDSSGQGNHTLRAGGDAGLELRTGQAVADGGLLNGQTIDYVESDGSSDLIGAQLNGGTPPGQFTIIALMDYAGTNSNDRVGFGSYRKGDTANNFNLAADGSIRKDNGSVGGSGAVPNEFFVRAASFNGGTYNDYYIRAGGTTVNKNGGSFGQAAPGTDDFYMGDLRSGFSGDGFAQVAVYDTNLSQATIEDISAWMASNPNARPAATTLTQTLDTANVVEDAGNDVNYAVEVDGADIRIFDRVNGGGANRTSQETIADAGGNVSHYQVTFVHTSPNTGGTGNMEFLEIGDGANDFATVAINRLNGVDRFGTSNGGSTNIANAVNLVEGMAYGVSIFMNATAAALAYSDPLGGTQLLAGNTYDVWFGPASGPLALLADGIAEVDADTADLDTAKYRMRSVGTIQFETVWSPGAAAPADIPEPATMCAVALAVAGLGGYVRRRGGG